MSDGPSIVDRLADHLRAGTRLDLLPDVAPDEHGLRDVEEMAGWGPEH